MVKRGTKQKVVKEEACCAQKESKEVTKKEGHGVEKGSDNVKTGV